MHLIANRQPKTQEGIRREKLLISKLLKKMPKKPRQRVPQATEGVMSGYEQSSQKLQKIVSSLSQLQRVPVGLKTQTYMLKKLWKAP
jgi:hypothetical protein